MKHSLGFEARVVLMWLTIWIGQRLSGDFEGKGTYVGCACGRVLVRAGGVDGVVLGMVLAMSNIE